MEIFIVFEILNDYILGVYSSELDACEGLSEDFKENFDLENEHGDEDWNHWMKMNLEDDYKIYKMKMNEKFKYGDWNPKKNKGEYLTNGVEYKYENFIEIKQRIRELKIDSLI